jgi:hypothetical protein
MLTQILAFLMMTNPTYTTLLDGYVKNAQLWAFA